MIEYKMCGFIGIALSKGQINFKDLVNANQKLHHRGPDASGIWLSGNKKIGLAHSRLAIQDISSMGSQPMHFKEQGLTIVFNGEIYNFQELKYQLSKLGYSFNSRSDTEVILKAYVEWGSDCISKFNGMFTFAVYDENNQRLFLARDRVGEKPLFYKLEDNSLQFSSELKALMAYEVGTRNISTEALDCYLGMGFIPNDMCILKGFCKLPPAHAMMINLQTFKKTIWKYWEIKKTNIDHDLDEIKLLDKLESLLEDSVSRQLISDVPVGVLLSGGLDSSLITAMAVRNSNKVKTFNIGFAGHENIDETQHARLIANFFDTEHIELQADTSIAGMLPALAEQFDEPMVDSSMFPTWLVSNLVSQHCKAAIGGDGGDELFGGYEHYSRLLNIEQKTKHLPLNIRKPIANITSELIPLGFLGRNLKTWVSAIGSDFNKTVPMVSCLFDKSTRSKLMGEYNNHPLIAENIYEENIPNCEDLLGRATRIDFQNYLAEDLLVKVDRTSMMNSLELRAPFLDYHLIDFAFSKIPANLKATKSNKKILLKRLASRVLPPNFDNKRKQGFSIPLNEWLKSGPFKELFWETLRSKDCIFDIKVINKLLRDQERGRNNGERLFSLVLFEHWRKKYDINI